MEHRQEEQEDMKKQDSMKKRNSVDRQQAWESCDRQSVESVSSANGWLKSGYVGVTGGNDFFCPGILH